MGTSRPLAAALGTLVGATALALTGTSAVAGDNDREDWSGQRALKIAEGETKGVRLLTNDTPRWALLARQTSHPGATPETWRLREYRGTKQTGYGWRNPANAPTEVTSFRYAQSQDGRVKAAWIHDGGLFVGFKTRRDDARGGGRISAERLGDEVPGAEPPRIYTPQSGSAAVVIDYANIWHRYVPPPPRGCNGCDYTGGWVTSPAPADPAGAATEPTVVESGLAALWTGDTRVPGDRALRYARLTSTPDGPAWGQPQVITTDDLQAVDLVSTRLGSRLVTVGPDGQVTLFNYDPQAAASGTLAFSNQRTVSRGQPTDGLAPRVALDRKGNLTLAWRGPDPEAGLLAWQENRPRSRFLEKPTLVPGTQHTETATLTAAPSGSLTVVFQPDRHRRSVQSPRAVHLPAGSNRWTDSALLESPKPAHSRGSFSVGQPRLNGDAWVAANDDAGVWVHQFDAPEPRTKMTLAGKTHPRDRTYTVEWKATWAYVDDYEVRARVNKKSGWQDVAVPAGERSKTVTRPRGETRCYQARGVLGARTDWSKALCVTVSR